jgi:hypothetical protein
VANGMPENNISLGIIWAVSIHVKGVMTDRFGCNSANETAATVET